MKSPASSLNSNNRFLIFGCGFSGSFFAKKIRELGYTALTSSRSEKKDPDSFVFNSEIGILPNKKTFDGVTHILSCIPPDKNGNDPVLESLQGKLQDLPLEWVGYLSSFKFYQKLFVFLISFSTILIIPESPKELENICETYNSRKICNVW